MSILSWGSGHAEGSRFFGVHDEWLTAHTKRQADYEALLKTQEDELKTLNAEHGASLRRLTDEQKAALLSLTGHVTQEIAETSERLKQVAPAVFGGQIHWACGVPPLTRLVRRASEIATFQTL